MDQKLTPDFSLPDFSLGAKRRLKKRAQFLKLQDSGTRASTKHLILFFSASGCDETRFGVTVSKKISKRANIRNLLKRRLKSLFRLSRPYLKIQAVDLLVVARKGAEELSYHELENQWNKALALAKLR